MNNDIDIWEEAIKSMNLNKNIQFVSRGKLITESSQVEMFNKIQALLNTNEMECSHKWLYSLDPSELNENEISKVNNLYNLACNKGLIQVEQDQQDQQNEQIDDKNSNENLDQNVNDFEIKNDSQESVDEEYEKNDLDYSYVGLYSAIRNGEIKTGEAYSNAINPQGAKLDIINNLEKAGYANIKILAIECGKID